jgi:hypothetical protein
VAGTISIVNENQHLVRTPVNPPALGYFANRDDSTTAVYHKVKGEIQRMSDTVLVALIAATPGILSTIVGFVNKREISKAATLAAKAADTAEEGAKLGAKNEQHLAETKTAMTELALNTNSIKDELVKTTAIANRAIGNREGRAELKAENNSGEEQSG